MKTAVSRYCPARLLMIMRINLITAMAGVAELTVLMTDAAILFFALGIESMCKFIIQRMRSLIQVFPLMAILTEILLMAISAGHSRGQFIDAVFGQISMAMGKIDGMAGRFQILFRQIAVCRESDFTEWQFIHSDMAGRLMGAEGAVFFSTPKWQSEHLNPDFKCN